MKGVKGLVLGLGFGCLLSLPAHAVIIFSFEAAGVQQTTVAGAVTEDFNSPAAAGSHATYASPIGTYTPLKVSPANVYGGAGRVGGFADLNGTPLATTLTFAGNKTYFGMWWSAGDGTDLLQFYSGSSLVGTFVVGDLIPYLGNPATSPYYGNPNSPGGNAGEPYAYVNFTATLGTTFDKVVFTETDGGGFESDNHSVFDQPINPPGTVVPEPATVLAGALIFAFAAVRGLRKH